MAGNAVIISAKRIRHSNGLPRGSIPVAPTVAAGLARGGAIDISRQTTEVDTHSRGGAP